MKTYYRGDIYYADLRPVVGSEQGGIRPVVILQNNVGNRYSPTVIAAPITSRRKTNLPTHVSINRQVDKLRCNSVILMEQIRTIDKSRLMDRIGVLNDYEMQQVTPMWAVGSSSMPRSALLRWSMRDRLPARSR